MIFTICQIKDSVAGYGPLVSESLTAFIVASCHLGEASVIEMEWKLP